MADCASSVVQADDLHVAVRRTEVDGAFRIDGKGVGDRLIGQRSQHANQQAVKRLDLMRRLGNDFDRVDHQDIGRLDRVRR